MRRDIGPAAPAAAILQARLPAILELLGQTAELEGQFIADGLDRKGQVNVGRVVALRSGLDPPTACRPSAWTGLEFDHRPADREVVGGTAGGRAGRLGSRQLGTGFVPTALQRQCPGRQEMPRHDHVENLLASRLEAAGLQGVVAGRQGLVALAVIVEEKDDRVDIVRNMRQEPPINFGRGILLLPLDIILGQGMVGSRKTGRQAQSPC